MVTGVATGMVTGMVTGTGLRTSMGTVRRATPNCTGPARSLRAPSLPRRRRLGRCGVGFQRAGHPGGQDQPARARRDLAAQLAIVAISGSVALLADTIHNFSDALTAVAAVDGVRPRPAGADPPLHLRVRPCRRPRGTLRRRDDRPVGAHRRVRVDQPADQPGPGRPRRLGRRWPDWSASSATRRSRSTGSGSAARSARPPWSPTACTPAPTDSPHWPSLFGAAGVAAGFPRPTRSSACSSPWPSWPCCGPPCATSSAD